MMFKKKQIFSHFVICGFFLLLSHCTRVLLYASDHATDPVSRSYGGDPAQIYSQSVRLLDNMGYEMTIADEVNYQIVTGWKPVTSGSHYMFLFNRHDYSAATGAYYQIMLNFTAEGATTRVDIKTNVKSISGKLSSSKAIEKKFISRLDDALRSPQIDITNVGVENR